MQQKNQVGKSKHPRTYAERRPVDPSRRPAVRAIPPVTPNKPVAPKVLLQSKRKNNKTVKARQLRATTNGTQTAVDGTGGPMLSASSDNLMTTSSKVIPKTIVFPVGAMMEYAAAPIWYALQLGFANFADDPSYPYWAYVQLAVFLTSALQDTILQVQEVPRWLKYLMDIIRPKRVIVGSGYIAYNWQTSFDPTTFSPLIPMGPSGVNRNANFYYSTTSYVNNIIPQMQAPAPYTPLNGAIAWASLLNFMSDHDGIPKKMSEMVPAIGQHQFENDASCFCFIDQIMGTSSSGTGAFGKIVMSEAKIDHPQFAQFAAVTPVTSGDPTRYPLVAKRSSGSPASLSGMVISHFARDLVVPSKNSPIYGNVDFNRFVDILSNWACLVATNACQDFQGDPQNDNIGTPFFYQLQLTFQEFQIMLRNVFMLAFQDTQFLAQALIESDSYNNANPFVPFICSAGVYPTEEGGASALFPQLLVENVRDIISRTQDKSNPMCYIPLLGVYASDTLNGANYVVTPTGSPAFPLFAPPEMAILYPVAKAVPGKKVEEEMKLGSEMVINLVDGHYSGGYAELNAPFALSQYEKNWNDWVVKIRPYTDTMSTISRDAGINVLYVGGQTDILFNNIQGDPSLPKKIIPKERYIPDRLNISKKVSLGSYYDNRLREAVTGNSPFMTQKWEYIQRLWVRPEVMLNFNGRPNEIETVQKVASYSLEPHILSFQDNQDVSTLGQLHYEYAQAMYKTRNGDKNMNLVVLESMEAQGRGGLLSSLAASVIGGIFPGAASTLQGIASVIPF